MTCPTCKNRAEGFEELARAAEAEAARYARIALEHHSDAAMEREKAETCNRHGYGRATFEGAFGYDKYGVYQ